MNFDQNMVNSILGHFGVIKDKITVRKMIQHFDKKGQFLNLMHTKFLQFNMPKIFNDYGKRFFDVAFSLD